MPRRSHIRIDWLFAFRAVIQAGTVTGATSIILRTQPQISRMIASLEEELGVELFLRQGRRLFPTPHALEFLQAIAPMLEAMDSIDDTAQGIWSRRGRRTVVGAEPFMLHTILPDTIAACQKETTLTFSVNICERKAGIWKEQTTVDCAVVALPFSQTNFQPKIFAEVEMVAALPANHPLSKKTAVNLTDLAQFPFISLDDATLMRPQIDFAAVEASVTLNNVVETTSGVNACALVATGMGVTIADPIVAASFEQHGVIIKPILADLRMSYGFLLPPDSAIPGPVKTFMQECLRRVAIAGGNYVKITQKDTIIKPNFSPR